MSGSRSPAVEALPAVPARAKRSESLRVAFCIDNMNVGGTELNALRTARALRARGVELHVFCLTTEGPLIAEYEAIGIPVHPLPIGRLYGRATWRLGRELARTVREQRIVIVHAHDFYSNIFAAPFARLAGAAFIASRRWWEGPDRRAQRWANRGAYVLAHRVLANSPGVAQLLTDVERVHARSVVVVPNFLDDDAFEAPPPGWADALRAELGLPPDALVVGVVASLQPIKDHATLLRAAAPLAGEFPRLHLVLVGRDAGEQASLRALAAELGIADRVRLAGARPNQPSPHHLFDVSALTSVSEGLPNSLLEAMAAGKPVVATRVGAVADAVVHGETGFLVHARDATAVADALRPLLADPGLRERMGSAGRERAHVAFSRSAAIDRLMTLYHELAEMR